jgi:hypothetical protein
MAKIIIKFSEDTTLEEISKFGQELKTITESNEMKSLIEDIEVAI